MLANAKLKVIRNYLQKQYESKQSSTHRTSH
jgi:hypothetical protein